MNYSLLHTLATKHRKTLGYIIKNFGLNPTVYLKKKNKIKVVEQNPSITKINNIFLHEIITAPTTTIITKISNLILKLFLHCIFQLCLHCLSSELVPVDAQIAVWCDLQTELFQSFCIQEAYAKD